MVYVTCLALVVIAVCTVVRDRKRKDFTDVTNRKARIRIRFTNDSREDVRMSCPRKAQDALIIAAVRAVVGHLQAALVANVAPYYATVVISRYASDKAGERMWV